MICVPIISECFIDSLYFVFTSEVSLSKTLCKFHNFYYNLFTHATSVCNTNSTPVLRSIQLVREGH